MTNQQHIDGIMAKIQELEEIGGPDLHGYVEILLAVKKQIETRIETVLEPKDETK